MKPKKRNKGGRPAKMTLAMVEEIAKRIAKGMTEELACLDCEASYAAFKKAQQRCPAFVLAIKKAHARFQSLALDDIRAGKPGWPGAAWILERRHKPQFNRVDSVAVTDQEGGPVVTEDVMKILSGIARRLYVEPQKQIENGKQN